MSDYIIPFHKLSMGDLPKVGGKNASLGEMINKLAKLNIAVPDGVAITVDAFDDFMTYNELSEPLGQVFEKLDRKGLTNLADIAKKCRKLFLDSSFPEKIAHDIRDAYHELLEKTENDSVAVRSSATAEDSPAASFAGQHDSFLNIVGVENVLQAVKQCYASLYNDRAIKYRIDNGIADFISQSVGIQMMVRADKGSAGVIFTIEPENGNKNLIYVTGAWGLGESVVQGAVNTDEFYLFKPALRTKKNPIVYRTIGTKQQMMVYNEASEGKQTKWQQTSPPLRDRFVLSDDEVVLLGQWALNIEDYYERPMDIEWARDGISERLFIVQARPETVHSHQRHMILKEYKLNTDDNPLLRGKAVGRSVVSGKVSVVRSLADGEKVSPGDIIVADITNPDWNALLKKAVCIVTNKGGRTSHASIVARELQIPAVVGTGTATETLADGQEVTVSCISGDEGLIYDGKLDWEEKEVKLEKIPDTRTKPMFILANPQSALLYASYPNEGVGLLRMEFMITNSLQVHPMALIRYNELHDEDEKRKIDALTRHYAGKKDFFIDKLSESIALVAAAFYPKEVIVRMSDFKTNEYAKLLGGSRFEPEEENPMLGFRGASRYYNERYREGFGLECAAIKKVREDMLLENVKVMIPFCRTVEEGRKVLEVMAAYGLKRNKNLEVYVMAEIPSNVLLAESFAHLFDGFSIGSNDLTQLTLGLDRDSAIVSELFDENDESIKTLIRNLIRVAHEQDVKVGLCGQAPSDHPEFAGFLVECGIDSISFNPDAIIRGIENIAAAEKRLKMNVGI